MILVETPMEVHHPWLGTMTSMLRQIHAAEGNPFLQPLLLIDLLVGSGVSMLRAVSSLVVWVNLFKC